MIRRSPSQNQNQRRNRPRNLLEVSVRSQLANKQRNRRIAGVLWKVALVFALVGGAVVGAKEGFRRFFWENPKYNLAVVEIHNPTAALDRELILGASKLKLGENIFQISLSEAREALTSLPQVEGAELRRVLPNKVTIDLVERRPVAWLAEKGVEDAAAAESSFLVDPNGIVFKARDRAGNLRLPVIYGVPPQNYLPGDQVKVPELVAALELIHRNGETGRVGIRTVDLSKGYCILVTDARGRRISFPYDKAAYHLDRLAVVLEATTSRGMNVQTVNLLVEQNVPVTLVNHADDLLPPAPAASKASASNAPSAPNGPAATEASSESVASIASIAEASKPKIAKNEEPKKASKATPSKTSSRSSSRTATKRSASKPKPKPKPQKQEVRRAIPVRAVPASIPRAEPVRR